MIHIRPTEEEAPGGGGGVPPTDDRVPRPPSRSSKLIRRPEAPGCRRRPSHQPPPVQRWSTPSRERGPAGLDAEEGHSEPGIPASRWPTRLLAKWRPAKQGYLDRANWTHEELADHSAEGERCIALPAWPCSGSAPRSTSAFSTVFDVPLTFAATRTSRPRRGKTLAGQKRGGRGELVPLEPGRARLQMVPNAATLRRGTGRWWGRWDCRRTGRLRQRNLVRGRSIMNTPGELQKENRKSEATARRGGGSGRSRTTCGTSAGLTLAGGTGGGADDRTTSPNPTARRPVYYSPQLNVIERFWKKLRRMPAT
jgi:hypothetical protein